MKTRLLFLALFCLIISLVGFAQGSPLNVRIKRDDEPDQTTSQKEIRLAVEQAMKPFISLLEENIKKNSELNKNVEDIIKLLSNWFEKNKNETSQPPKNETSNAEDEKVYTSGEFKLTIVQKESADFSEKVRQQIIETFNDVYPKLRERFNKEAPKDIRIIIDPEYKEVAKASRLVQNPNDQGQGEVVHQDIRVNPTYLKEHPDDIDVITHELMHVVQSYPVQSDDIQPVWLVEGLADYARFKYAHDNKGWTLPDFQAGEQKYTDSYKITARFLVWLENKVNDKIVNELDSALRENRYQNGQIWNEKTQKSVDDLWNDYSNNSDL